MNTAHANPAMRPVVLPMGFVQELAHYFSKQPFEIAEQPMATLRSAMHLAMNPPEPAEKVVFADGHASPGERMASLMASAREEVERAQAAEAVASDPVVSAMTENLRATDYEPSA